MPDSVIGPRATYRRASTEEAEAIDSISIRGNHGYGQGQDDALLDDCTGSLSPKESHAFPSYPPLEV
jgi:hypothetical protein